MNDIIERLRRYNGPWLVPAEAADEIEKLRGEVVGAQAKIANYAQSCITLHNEIDRLKAERDAAVKALERIKNHVDTDEYAYEIAVAAIDAARGGK